MKYVIGDDGKMTYAPARERKSPSREVALEPVYTPREVASWLGKSEDTVRRLFKGDPKVLAFTTHQRRRGMRSYTQLRIPRSAILARFPSLSSKLPA